MAPPPVPLQCYPAIQPITVIYCRYMSLKVQALVLTKAMLERVIDKKYLPRSSRRLFPIHLATRETCPLISFPQCSGSGIQLTSNR